MLWRWSPPQLEGVAQKKAELAKLQLLSFCFRLFDATAVVVLLPPLLSSSSPSTQPFRHAACHFLLDLERRTFSLHCPAHLHGALPLTST